MARIGDKYTCENCGRTIIESRFPHTCVGIANSTIEVHVLEPDVNKPVLTSNEPDSTVNSELLTSRNEYHREDMRKRRADAKLMKEIAADVHPCFGGFKRS